MVLCCSGGYTEIDEQGARFFLSFFFRLTVGRPFPFPVFHLYYLRPNSIFKKDNDLAPLIIGYNFIGNSVLINFDRSMKRLNKNDTLIFSIDKELKISEIKLSPPIFDVITLALTGTIKSDTTYSITVKKLLTACDSTTILSNDEILKIQKPRQPSIGDIIINEVLVNPSTGGKRFIELFNRSRKVIDASSITISNFINNKPFVSPYLIFPDSFLVLTENPTLVRKNYNSKVLIRSFLNYKLPAWAENQDTIVLYDRNGVGLDTLKYTKSFHNPLLANTEGVSLERINPNKKNDKSNWQSAAKTVGYATPGYKNSQYLIDTPSVSSTFEDPFTLLKPSFSPDEDSFEDFLQINYKLDKTGAFVRVTVFDANGRLIKKLYDNEALATEGSLIWNGNTDENINAPVGIYILYIELILPTGGLQTFKKLVSLTTRL